MCIVLAAIFLVAICYDAAQARRTVAPGRWHLQGGRTACDILFWTALAGMVLTWVESGGAAFAADKRIVITAVGRWHVLWEMAASLGALLAFAFDSKVLLAGCLALIAVDMYIGFRYAFAITFIGLMTMVLSRFGPVRLKDTPGKYWLAGALGALFIISYQNLKEPLRAGDSPEIGRRLGSVQWYLSGIVTSEPFTTQTILNEIVRRDFTTGTARTVGLPASISSCSRRSSVPRRSASTNCTSQRYSRRSITVWPTTSGRRGGAAAAGRCSWHSLPCMPGCSLWDRAV